MSPVNILGIGHREASFISFAQDVQRTLHLKIDPAEIGNSDPVRFFARTGSVKSSLHHALNALRQSCAPRDTSCPRSLVHPKQGTLR